MTYMRKKQIKIRNCGQSHTPSISPYIVNVSIKIRVKESFFTYNVDISRASDWVAWPFVPRFQKRRESEYSAGQRVPTKRRKCFLQLPRTASEWQPRFQNLWGEPSNHQCQTSCSSEDPSPFSLLGCFLYPKKIAKVQNK